MRKIKTFVIVIMAALSISTAFYSCNKDENNLIHEDGGLIQKSLKELSFVKNPYSIEEYISNPEDIDDEKLDRQLYGIGLIARHLFKDANLNRHIMENAVKSASDCIDLRTFETWPSIDKYPPEVVDELREILKSAELTYVSKNPQDYGTVERYIPAIHVANIDNANVDMLPVFSPGISVNEELPGMEMYEDHLVVWYFDSELGDFAEGLISEEMALSMRNPLFIVDNACPEMITRRKGNGGGGGKNPYCVNDNITPEMRSSYYSTNEYQINVRYENSGKSELCATVAVINEYGEGHWVNNGTPWHLIDKVKKGDIGKRLSKWVTFCHLNSVGYSDVVPFECNYLFWNTFERDWAKSDKNFGSGSRNGTTVYLSGEAKHNSDWYAFAPGQVNANPLDLSYTFHNWLKTHHNAAGGMLNIWRVQP